MITRNKAKLSTVRLGGFTLIEIIIAISVIGVLIGVILLGINPAGQINKANDSRKLSDIKEISNALNLYYNDNSCFPAGSASNFATALATGGEWREGQTVYMKKVPMEAKGTPYTYFTDTSEGVTCRQWGAVFAKLSKPQPEIDPETHATAACPFAAAADPSCVPWNTDPSTSTSWACVTSGNTKCSPQSTSVAVIPNPPPPTCTNGYKDIDKDGYGAGASGCYDASISYNVVGNNNDCDDTTDTIIFGSTRTRYASQTVACGSACNSEVQTCGAGGIWSGTLTETAACAATTRTMYSSSSVACGSSCVSETQSCQNNGTWSGSYASSTCSPVSATTYYKDNDSDGYGSGVGGTITACTQPAGYASNNSDCYDSNANAKPGQTLYFSTGRGDVGVTSFDYDCNGTVERGNDVRDAEYRIATDINTYMGCGTTRCDSCLVVPLFSRFKVVKATQVACGSYGETCAPAGTYGYSVFKDYTYTCQSWFILSACPVTQLVSPTGNFSPIAQTCR